MLLLSCFAPVIITGLLKGVFPLLCTFLSDQYHFDLKIHYRFACVMMLHLFPLLFGMVYGFIMLDERDEGIFLVYAVTPFGTKGYFKLRMLSPVLFCILVIMLFIWITDFEKIIWIKHLPLAVITSLQAPILFLFLGGFAQNKVEGIALSKGFGILLIAIVVDYLMPTKWTLLAGVSPLFWTARAFLSEQFSDVFLNGMIALLFHSVFLILLFRKFLQVKI